MRTFLDSKAMAKSLRSALTARGVDVAHSDALELVALAFDCKDWNTLAARIESTRSTAQPARSEVLPPTEEPRVELYAPVPIIRIFDVAKARAFYLERLGFRLEWEHRFGDDFPLYMQASRSGATLHLSEHAGDGTPGSISYIRVKGLDQLQRELAVKGFKEVIDDGPGNLRTLQIWDPFSNRLRFSEAKPGLVNSSAQGYSVPD